MQYSLFPPAMYIQEQSSRQGQSNLIEPFETCFFHSVILYVLWGVRRVLEMILSHMASSCLNGSTYWDPFHIKFNKVHKFNIEKTTYLNFKLLDNGCSTLWKAKGWVPRDIMSLGIKPSAFLRVEQSFSQNFEVQIYWTCLQLVGTLGIFFFRNFSFGFFNKLSLSRHVGEKSQQGPLRRI